MKSSRFRKTRAHGVARILGLALFAVPGVSSAQFAGYRSNVVEEPAMAVGLRLSRSMALEHSDVIVARYLGRSEGKPRDYYFDDFAFEDNRESRPVWLEDYEVFDSANGTTQGRVRAVFVAHLDTDGRSVPMRARQPGQTVVAIIDPPVDGVLGIANRFDPSIQNKGVFARAEAGNEVSMTLSIEVASAELAGVGKPLDTVFVSTAVASLARLQRSQQIRTLELLGSMEKPGSLPTGEAPDELSRRLLGVVDDLDARDRWLAFRALRTWGNLDNLPELFESLRLVAGDKAEWDAYPMRGSDDYLWLVHWPEIGAGKPERLSGVLGRVGEAIDFAASAVDLRLATSIIQNINFGTHPDVRATRVRELWIRRDSRLEEALLFRLSEWTGKADKKPDVVTERGRPRDMRNRAELVLFWTQYLEG